MYTTRFHHHINHFHYQEGEGRGEAPKPTFDDYRQAREKADSGIQARKLLEGMARSRDAQARGAQAQAADRFDAQGTLDRELSIAMIGTPPTRRIEGIDPTEQQNKAQALLRIKPEAGEKTLAQFPDAKWSATENGVDIFLRGDRTILSRPGKDPVDFSTEVFNGRKDLIMSQYGAKSETSTETRVAQNRPAKTQGVRLSGERSSDSTRKVDVAPKSDQVLLDQARQDKATALGALAFVQNPEGRKVYEEMMRKADSEITRLEESLRVARLSPEARELEDMKKGIGAIRKEFEGLISQEARGVKIDKKRRDSLMQDLIEANATMKKLERSHAEVARLEGDIRTAKATIDARRGNDTYGTLQATINTGQKRIDELKTEMVATKGGMKQILAKHTSEAPKVA